MVYHILSKKNSENGDGEQTLDKLVDVIAKATDVEIQRNPTNLGNDRIKLNYDNYTAVLSQSPHGNHWLLTGWENKKETVTYANGEVYDSSEATTVTSTLTHRNRGNDTVSKYSISNNSEKVNNSSTQYTEKYSVDDDNKTYYNSNRGDINDRYESFSENEKSPRGIGNGAFERNYSLGEERPRTKRITVSGNSYEVINSSAETAQQKRLKEQNSIEFGLPTYYTINALQKILSLLF